MSAAIRSVAVVIREFDGKANSDSRVPGMSLREGGALGEVTPRVSEFGEVRPFSRADAFFRFHLHGNSSDLHS